MAGKDSSKEVTEPKTGTKKREKEILERAVILSVSWRKPCLCGPLVVNTTIGFGEQQGVAEEPRTEPSRAKQHKTLMVI